MKAVDRAIYGLFALALVGCGLLTADKSGHYRITTSQKNCDDLQSAGFCDGNNCDIYVQVSQCNANSVVVVPDPLSVCAKTKLKWHLYAFGSASGATFASVDGVYFKDPNQVEDPVPKGNTYEWKDKYNKNHDGSKKELQYGFNILKADKTTLCVHVDPVVINE